MKLMYFGGGYVGACSAAVSADSGHEVLVYDINSELIQKFSSGDKDEIESALFEQGLGEMIIRSGARLRFSDKLEDVAVFADSAEAVFMCLPTPEKDGTGETDLTIYEKAAGTLAGALAGRNGGAQSQYVLIINKSTVPIEMVHRTMNIMDGAGVKNYGVGSNPEFLVEGKAIEGSVRPARVVVGAESENDFAIFRKIYSRFSESPNVAYIEVNPCEAEAGKLMANFLLFNRLANCFDVIGRVCENYGDLHFENIRRILVSDKRIGDWGFHDSLFAGGSCFIKDARSLAFHLSSKGAAADLVNDTLTANRRQLETFLGRAEKDLGFDWKNKKVGLLGLAFKRDTNDIRNSAALGVTEFLLEKHVELIKAFDPAAGGNYLKYFQSHPDAGKLSLVANEASAIMDADVLIIAADWPRFREIDGLVRENLPKGALIMDGRRMLQAKYDELAEAGYRIIAVGSGTFG